MQELADVGSTSSKVDGGSVSRDSVSKPLEENVNQGMGHYRRRTTSPMRLTVVLVKVPSCSTPKTGRDASGQV